MIDVAWTQLLLLSALTFLLLGPKEVPVVLRFLGRWVGKARRALSAFHEVVDPYMSDLDITPADPSFAPPRTAFSAIPPRTFFVTPRTDHPFCSSSGYHLFSTKRDVP